MLCLSSRTDPSWARSAAADLDAVLLDHAHLEKKAAGAAVTLLFRYPHVPHLQAPLSRLAREELAHFEEVLRFLERRSVGFGPQQASPYAGRLHAQIRGVEPDRLLDTLLVAAVIEARSCERLGLLADAIEADEPELAGFQRGLLAAEARHHGDYVRLADGLSDGLGDASRVRVRLGEIADAEARILSEMPDTPRLHNGGARWARSVCA